MVAKITIGKNIRGMLSYNEHKVKNNLAECIHENLFGCHTPSLPFSQKVAPFENRTLRNRRATSNALHISLNFHNNDILSKEKLVNIATSYMDKIGFADQPYLVYQHFDAAHPHIHIVTTNIDRNARRIILFNIGRNQSEAARKSIEIEFALTKAQSRAPESRPTLQTPSLEKITYGKSETKHAISQVVHTITRTYKYTSLAELNAILGLFNVLADCGTEGSKMNSHRGLVYRIIDNKGTKMGVPIKSSSIHGKPTLAYLEKQFKLNAILKPKQRHQMVTTIDEVLRDKPDLRNFKSALTRKGISVVLRQNPEGLLYGITFVDHHSKVVFNGSDLGKNFSAAAITRRLSPSGEKKSPLNTSQPLAANTHRQFPKPGMAGIINDLLEAKPDDATTANLPAPHPRKKRKKRRSI